MNAQTTQAAQQATNDQAARAAMADGIRRAKQAAEQQPEGEWYTGTTAKVVGGVIVAGVVVAAGYYAYKHFTKGTVVSDTLGDVTA